jgi:hypothetical protein
VEALDILITLAAATTRTARVAGHDVHHDPEAVRELRDQSSAILLTTQYPEEATELAGLGVLAVAVALGTPCAAGHPPSSPSPRSSPDGPSGMPACTGWSGSGRAVPRR